MNRIKKIALLVVALLASLVFLAVGASAQNSNMSGDQMKSSSGMNKSGMMRRRMRRHPRRIKRRTPMMKKKTMDNSHKMRNSDSMQMQMPAMMKKNP